MNPFKFLMGATGSADKVLSAAIKGGDALFHTEEEKAQYKLDCHTLFLKQLEAEGNSLGSSSITRRVLAFMLVGLWVLYGFAAGLFWGLEMPTVAQGYINLMSETKIPVGMALTFYFGRHFVDGIGSR
jgi:hypothetical protein